MSTCPNCKGLAMKTQWIPPEGIDPFLVEYQCLSCKVKFYGRRVSTKKEGGIRIPITTKRKHTRIGDA